MSGRLLSVASALALSGAVSAQVLPESQLQNAWFQDGQAQVNDRLALRAQQTADGSTRNVILFVGDGMGISTLSAARILSGQRLGESGEEGRLSFESFEHTALVKTYNIDAQIPDSPGSMTAMMSGIKTNAGAIGVNASASVGDCLQVSGNELVSALDLAEAKGMATGLVSTARITHSTPAAAYAKTSNREWEDISDQPASVVQQGCEDIALQLVNFEKNLELRFPNADVNGIDVVFGGGRRHFLPNESTSDLVASFGQANGDRSDGRNLISEWQATYPEGQYVFDTTGLDALDTSAAGNVFGLFSSSHMRYNAQRDADVANQPSLSMMVVKAIEVLRNRPAGYLLIVEAGRIAHAHKANNAHGALDETIELSNAVKLAQELTDSSDTLILVTADHSNVMTFSGYPKRGNPILGKVISAGGVSPALDSDGLPYTTLGYANGPGFRNYGANTNPDKTFEEPVVSGRQNLEAVDTEAPGFHQETLVPLKTETHGGEDVTVHATGAGSSRVQGTIEQNLVFHVIDQAMGLTR